MVRIACRLDDIAEGTARGVLADGRGRATAVIVRRGGRLFAYVNNCPHYDRAPLGWKKDAFLNGAGDRIMCASHGALFRIEDGVCVLGPCLGQALEPLPLHVADGMVMLETADREET